MPELPPRPTETEADELRRRRKPLNLAVIWVLLALAGLFYAITIVKMMKP